MAWIAMIPEDEAEGELARAYERAGSRQGPVAHILKVQGQNPRVMEAHLGLYRAIMYGPSPLSRAQREMIAVTVSAANRCHY